MRYARSRITSPWLVMLVCAGLMMSLSACGTKPVKQPTLNVPQPTLEIPPEATKRDKPLVAMQPCDPQPELHESVTALTGEDQARVILNAWLKASEASAACREKQAALARWIERD